MNLENQLKLYVWTTFYTILINLPCIGSYFGRPTMETLSELFGMDPVCPYRCPELDACINASLWCDNVPHCPSGRDEAFLTCSPLVRLPMEHAAILMGLLLLLLLMLCLMCAWCRKRRRRRRSILEARLKSLSSSETPVFNEKEVIC